ncbi:MAG TPA: Fe-S cluster assembly ATPase SufC, partial [Gammaproteobacteria bacterium]|nr:Fe-S cluster assembly ATPase SufC [Gammaproteobacteria bacterium]
TIRAGEVHALMGPNGSGKSTLANLLARKEGYVVKQGAIRYLDEDLLALSPEECAWKGLFLGFQYPVSIPGVTNIQFLKSAFNAVRKAQGKPPMDAVDFLAVIKEKMAFLEMPEALLYRSLNDGFSGGEKKRNEILQMSLLEPKLAILDETDSGLDIDALKEVARGINALRSKDRAILLITHYQRLLDYIEPDFVHVIANGKLVKSGDKFLALELERKGYGWV